MAKIQYRKISSKERDKMLKALAKVITTCKAEKDTRRLLERLLTPSEIVMLTRRVQIASMLVQGKSQWDIREQLGAGFSTIRSVENWLDKTFENYRGIRTVVKSKRRKKQYATYRTSIADWRENPLSLVISKSDPYFAIFQLLIRGAEYFLEDKKQSVESRVYSKHPK